ncbi:sulfate transporter 4.1 [Xylariomycetidae sp. FL0641]|nr:sulfate transporter 4.1 [Xylariomycetidae sp. FL0641]
MEKAVRAVKTEVKTDVTLNRVVHYARTTPPKLPSATKQYLLDKLPIIQWLPRYSPSWLPNDFNLSTGPTSVLGLLTAEIIKDLKDEFSVTSIASAVAFMVGVWSLIIGLLGLGFLLEYVSIPVLTGFISATALIIGMGQVDSLVGLDDVPDGVFNQIGNILKRLPHWDGPTCGIGIGTILLMVALDKVGKRWGKKHFVIKYLGSSRAVLVLVVFTLISWLVNRGRDEPLWAVSEVDTHGIPRPVAPASALIPKVAARAIAPLVACTLEHQAVGKAFARRNHYMLDQTQEFTYLGVTNIVNSFFGAMPCGGAMSRTAVNSECHVKSPLNGLVTAGFIILTLYAFSPALYWLPKSTLAAIIIMAVIHLFGPLSLIWRYWRISLADFIACMVAFWVTIFVSSEIGIGAAAGWSVAWTLLRSAFVTPDVSATTSNSSSSTSSPYVADSSSASPSPSPRGAVHAHDTASETEQAGVTIPEDTVLVRFRDAVFFPNAQRSKGAALEAVQLVYPPLQDPHYRADSERSWSVQAERRLARLRAQRGVAMKDLPLAVVVLDFTRVPFVDASGLTALAELKDDLRRQLAANVQLRFLGLSPRVRHRFRRAGWKLADVDGAHEDGADLVYPSLDRAVWDDGASLKGVTTEKT